MKSKLKIVKPTGETEKPVKTRISEKEFRRKLKEIDEWRKERLAKVCPENSR
ncbi:MAG: hypothetical protein M3525_06990 [Acidobacteriota bacterium]|nr:hypothetical protein [Acidobacteriota bacterium]